MRTLMFLLFLLPVITIAQGQQRAKVKVVSVEMLELTEIQMHVADRIEQQYQKRLTDAIKILPVDRKEAYLQIALAVMNANDQYLSILSWEQRGLWEEAVSKATISADQKELQLNSEGKSRTIALAVR